MLLEVNTAQEKLIIDYERPLNESEMDAVLWIKRIYVERIYS